ncbi:hypothetical protein CDD83_6095 [Cordyceps sp. RAO-2017]|nr:hypothetical protein CDD83_6095 [Cordyceps sp. RAO-2017]
MRAIAIASSLAALAAAAAAERTENIRISKFLVRKNAAPDGTTIRVVDFKLDGDDAHGLGCTVQAPAYYPKPSEVSTCGSSKYRFALHPGNDTEFSLRIYHETGLA